MTGLQAFGQALAAKRKDLRKQGQGRKPNAAEPLSEQEKQLWKCGQLGGHSPHALNHTMWWLNTLHFGWRGRVEHRRTCKLFSFQNQKRKKTTKNCSTDII